jgi:hypothetical protein
MKTMCNVDDLSCDRLGLFEPSDVKIRGNLFIYLADSKNHLIRILEFDKRAFRTLTLKE